MCQSILRSLCSLGHSLAKVHDTVGVLAPNSFVESSLEPFSFSSVSTPCKLNSLVMYRSFLFIRGHVLKLEVVSLTS